LNGAIRLYFLYFGDLGHLKNRFGVIEVLPNPIENIKVCPMWQMRSGEIVFIDKLIRLEGFGTKEQKVIGLGLPNK
jgi:hypothetical protein